MKTTRTFTDILNVLENRKSAAVKKAETPSSAPEKDPTDKGTVSAPHDPNSDPAKANMPANAADNTDATPTLTPPTVDKTVAGSEPCSINMKIANTVVKIRDLVSTTKKQAVAEKTVPAGSPSLPTGQAEVKSIPAKPTEKGAPKDPPSGKLDESGAKKADAPGSPKDQIKGDKDPAEKGKVEVKSDPIDGLPKGKDAENTNKMAGEDFLQFDPSFHFKIASEILATEEGRQFAENILLQSLGQEAANDLIKAAAIMEHQAEEAAAYEASGAAYADALWENATPAERESIVKIASIHEYQKSRFTGEFAEIAKAAYDQGAEAAAGQMDGASPAPTDATATPMTDGSATPASGADGNQEVSEDDIVQVLQQLVQSGELTPEVAEQLLTELLGGDGDQGGDAAGAAPGGSSADAGGAAAASQVPPEISEPVAKAAAIVNEILKKEAAATKSAVPATTV